MRSGLLAIGLICLFLPDAYAIAAPDLEAAFHHPAKSERPFVRWWWPGGAIEDHELARQIGLLDAAGVGGAEIQPFGLGITGEAPEMRAAIDSYGEPAFFDRIRAAAAAAASHGMHLDYTFGSAWPSGGGLAITPEAALLELSMAATTLTGGIEGPVKVAIPKRTSRLGAFPSFDRRWKIPEAADWPERMDARARIVAVLAMRGDPPSLMKVAPVMGMNLSPWSDVARPGTLDSHSTLNLTDKLEPDGTLHWSPPPGTWQVLVFKQYAANTSVTGSAGKGPQLVLDHFDKAAFALQAAHVGDPMVAALDGSKAGLRATFIDSVELMQDLPWTQNFLAEFKTRRGYDLTPYLGFILQPGWMQAWDEHYSLPYYQATDEDIADRVRADYRQTVSDLMIDNFVAPFVEWNHQHGLLAKFQAHGSPIDVIRGYGAVDIPETENLGADYDALGMRFARSAADIYGRPLVSAEALAFKDHPFDRTPTWLRARIDMFFAAGVNAETLHGYAYAPASAKWPGWYPFAPTAYTTGFGTMFNQENPTWASMPLLTGYMARMNAVMRRGTSVVPIALFYGEIGNYRGIEDRGAGAQTREKLLIANGYDYDRMNPDGLGHARMVHGRLTTAGGHEYRALVIPQTSALRAETAAKIASFAEAGLPVIFTDTIPHRDVGLFQAEVRDQQVRESMAKVLKTNGRLVPEEKLADALKSALIARNLTFTTDSPDVVFTERKVGERLMYFLYNCADEPRDASFIAPLAGGAQRWNALDGTIAPQTARAERGGTAIALRLESHESALIIVDPASRPRNVNQPTDALVQTLPRDGWGFKAVGHSSGGEPFSEANDNKSLGDYATDTALAGFSGVATYSTDFSLGAPSKTAGSRLIVDLGLVHDMAIITINGHRLGPLISAPWQRDITPWMKGEGNHIDIEVANVPQNALRDGSRPGYKKLLAVPAGLIGPVTIVLRSPSPKQMPGEIK